MRCNASPNRPITQPPNRPIGFRNVLLVLKADVLFALHMMLLYAGTTMPEQVRVGSLPPYACMYRATQWSSGCGGRRGAGGARAVDGGCGDGGGGVVGWCMPVVAIK